MTLDDIKKLQQKKYRSEFSCFVVEGEHLVLELQKAAAVQPLLLRTELYVTSQFEHWPSPFKTHVLTAQQMARIADTETPQGILAVVPFLPAAKAPETTAVVPERAVYLHEIQDPGNLGTILRTLAWFGGFRCLLSPGSVDPYNPKVVRASMGAIFHVPMELDVAMNSLSDRFARIACLDLQGSPLPQSGFADFACYVFGNEARGVPPEFQAAVNATPFTIHGCGAIDSLNLAAAVNMCLYELNR